jgi:hypothetical protein
MSRVLRAGTAAGPAPKIEPRAVRNAGRARSPDAAPEAPPRGWAFQDLPSGLASLVFHFAVLIVLGLVVTESSRPHLTEVIVDWAEGTDELAGGGGGTDGTEDVLDPAPLDAALADAAADDLASAVPELDNPLFTETQVVSEWGEVSDEIASPIGPSDVLADVASIGELGLRGIGTGGGSGGGRGKGHGPGVGDGTGPGSATGMFGLRDEGRRIVYVFDRSESMNSVFTYQYADGKSKSITSLQAAKDELLKSVNELSNGGEFAMVFYNDFAMAFQDHYAPDGISHADDRTKEAAQQFIYQLVAEQNTNHLAGLEMALALEPDVIFLLTDGEAKDDPTSSALRRIMQMRKRAKTRINVIHFCYEERPNSPLVSLATRTEGQFKSIPIKSLLDPTKW